MKRIGVIGIIVKRNRETALEVQKLLSDYGNIIMGRMGVPGENGISAISVIVKGTNEEISALTGKLGRLDKVSVKSALISAEIEEV
ncbi:MAG TPA: CopG family transcriptional regulator [Candidatus Faecicola pullistercoris]|nr:CopG family transcriptional regulator [Candidatus Faecicola pullistercoris]